MKIFRYFIYVLAAACLIFVYSLRLAFHSTIICQYGPNDTEHYLSDPALRGWSFASVSFGLFFGLVILTLTERFGTKNVTLMFGAIGSISCVLYPLSDSIGFWPAFVIRTIQGMPGALVLWAINNVSLEWAPSNEKALAIAIISSVHQLAPIIAMVTSAEMCSTFGWQYTYYLLGGLNALVHILFSVFYTNDATKNRFLSKEECLYIAEGSTVPQGRPKSVPLSQALKDVQIWIIWIMFSAYFTGMYGFLQYGPTYINQVLGLDIRGTGYAGALPLIIALAFKFIFGPMLDRFTFIDLKPRLAIGYAVVEVSCALCLFAIGMTSSAFVGMLIYIIFNSLHGLAIIVIVKQAQNVCGQYAHFILNVNTGIASLIIFVLPIFFNWVVKENTRAEWALLFIGLASLLILAVLLFSIFGKVSQSKWAEIEAVEKLDIVE